MNDLRRDFGDKGKDHVKHLKRCHELDIRIKSLQSREIEIDSTIERYNETSKEHKNKTRQLLRDLDALRLAFETASRELEAAQDGTRDYRERVQRKEFEIVRANYEYVDCRMLRTISFILYTIECNTGTELKSRD